jgi:hypothetical protein
VQTDILAKVIGSIGQQCQRLAHARVTLIEPIT